MKKFGIHLATAAVTLGCASVYGAGFALYEGSASAVARGGAVIGKAVDGSAVFYNPATMADFTNTVVSVGFVTEHPTADASVNSHNVGKMDPGGFLLPHAYVIQPLGWDFTFGMGVAPEFGLGSHYRKDWPLRWDTQKTTIEGVSFSPNLAYNITKDWSVAAGFRLMYVSFDQISYRQATQTGFPLSLGTVEDRLKGDNGMLDWGWEISTRYKITDKLSAGAMYRSYIDTKIKGHNNTRVEGYDDTSIGMLSGVTGLPSEAIQNAVAAGAAARNGSGSAKIRLPASLVAGLNYELTPDVELATALTWTQWSTIKNIHFNLPGEDEELYLGWKDTYRLGTGVAWHFAENWTWMNSYVYDMDPCRKRYGSTMLPAGDRHILATGLSWKFWDNWEISGVFGYIVMCEKSLMRTDALGNEYKFDTHRGRSISCGLTLSYYF